MPDFIVVSIDVTKIDKGRLIESKRQGSTAKYLELCLVPKKEMDEWGNEWFITQGLSKEDRDKGIKAPIIGNARRPKGKTQPTQPSRPQPKPPTVMSGGPSAKHTNPNDKDEDDDGSLPF